MICCTFALNIAMKQFSLLSITACLMAALMMLTSNAFAQNRKTASTAFEAYEHVNGNELIKKMIAEKREFNKNRYSKNAKPANLSAPQYILNRSIPTIISFNGLDYLVQHNCILAVKGLNLSDDALMQMTEKLLALDQVQFGYAEKINLAYNGGNHQKIRNLDKWYLLTLRIISTTVNDFAKLAKKYDSAAFAQNLVKMTVPNIDAISTPSITESMAGLAK